MADGSDILAAVCRAIDDGRVGDAAAKLSSQYPFVSFEKIERRYSTLDLMRLFQRDGFIDRYSGRRLVLPGSLRLLSKLLPTEFQYHSNWKTDACHFAYYELCPTADHLVPVSRGGANTSDNLVCTSMIRNAAKANFTVEELGWQLHPIGDLARWDGLTGWFLRQFAARADLSLVEYLRRWAIAAREV